MARIWSEKYGESNLLELRAVLVRVASFTFHFDSEQRLRECLHYYEQKVHASSIVPAKILESQLGADWREQRGWEVERWFERLPMHLLEEPKRQRVVKALKQALEQVESGKLTFRKPR